MEGCRERRCYVKISLIALFISIIVGITVGILYFFELIPITVNLIKIALAMSTIVIAGLWGSLFVANIFKEGCRIECSICKISKGLLVGGIGTFLASTVTLIIGVVVPSLIATVFVGFTGLFFSLMIIEVIALIANVIEKNC